MKTTIVGFGDSLTYGYGVASKYTHMKRLQDALPEKYPNVEWKVINSGENGDTTMDALSRLNRDVIYYNPDIVIILFGSNDSSFEEYQYNMPALFRKNMEKIVYEIKNHQTGSTLNGGYTLPILMTPPPVEDLGFFAYTDNERIQKYGGIVKEVAEKYGCPLFDFYNYVMEKTGGDYEDCLQFDGVHLRNKGYDLIYECTLEGLCALLDENGILKDVSMKEKTLERLNKSGVEYELYEHTPVYTIEEMEKLGLPHSDCIAKNLFLRNQNGKEHYLVSMEKNKTADLKELSWILGAKNLSFASEERLKKYLGLEKGSVSPLGVLNNDDSSVKIIFDEDLAAKELVGIHPNENTATVFMKFEDLEELIRNHGNSVQIIKL